MDEKALFTKFWTQETRTTRNVLARIPDGSDYRPDPRSRTAQEIAWQIVCEEKMLIEGVENGRAEWSPPPMPDSMAEVLAEYERQSDALPRRWADLPAEKFDGKLEFLGLAEADVAHHEAIHRLVLLQVFLHVGDGLELPVRHRAPSRPDHDVSARDGLDRAADLRTERGRAVNARVRWCAVARVRACECASAGRGQS